MIPAGKGFVDKDVYITRGENVWIDASARIDKWVKIEGGQGVQIGKNVHIASFCHLNLGGGSLDFGDHSGCSSGVKICSANPDLDYLLISAAESSENVHVTYRQTVIGMYVVIFANAVILPGITLGDGCVVGAGAVVTRDVEPWTIVAGNPARFLRRRDPCQLKLPYAASLETLLNT